MLLAFDQHKPGDRCVTAKPQSAENVSFLSRRVEKPEAQWRSTTSTLRQPKQQAPGASHRGGHADCVGAAYTSKSDPPAKKSCGGCGPVQIQNLVWLVLCWRGGGCREVVSCNLSVLNRQKPALYTRTLLAEYGGRENEAVWYTYFTEPSHKKSIKKNGRYRHASHFDSWRYRRGHLQTTILSVPMKHWNLNPISFNRGAV